MTAATSGRSSGASVSFSTIDAIFSTSYGVRFLPRAYERSTWRQFSQNVSTWSLTSCRDVVVPRKSYVAGNRNPSTCRCACGVKQGTVSFCVATAYCLRLTATGLCFLRFAIFATTATRSAICARVKPSGKITRNGFGGGGGSTVVAGADRCTCG